MDTYIQPQVMEEKTRYIQVPKQIMVPVQETIMVPQVSYYRMCSL